MNKNYTMEENYSYITKLKLKEELFSNELSVYIKHKKFPFLLTSHIIIVLLQVVWVLLYYYFFYL